MKAAAAGRRVPVGDKGLRSFGKRFWRTKALYLFVLPGLVFYAIFKYYPIYGSQIAFRDYSPYLGFSGSEWVGLENFQRFFNSPDFLEIIRNTLLINVTNLIIGFPFPILLALMLNQLSNQKIKKFVQTVTYAPYFISMVVLVGMMYTMFSPFSGVVNLAVKATGHDAIFFMGDVRVLEYLAELRLVGRRLHRGPRGREPGAARIRHRGRSGQAQENLVHRSAVHPADHRHHADPHRGPASDHRL